MIQIKNMKKMSDFNMENPSGCLASVVIPNDKVNHPSHYTWLKDLCGIEVIDITRHMSFDLGNVIKYTLRAGHKSEEGYSNFDKELEDLRKAKWYLDDEIHTRTKEPTDADKIAELEAQVKDLTKALNNARLIRTKETFLLSRKEIIKMYEELKDKQTSGPIKLVQSHGSGIGTNTTMVISNIFADGKLGETTSIDITDYDCW